MKLIDKIRSKIAKRRERKAIMRKFHIDKQGNVFVEGNFYATKNLGGRGFSPNPQNTSQSLAQK